MPNEAMNPIVSLGRSISQRFPDAQIEMDRPQESSGVWFLDISYAGHSVIVQWQRRQGFGITSSPDQSYGEQADEIYNDEEAAYGRIVSLLLSRTFTGPPPAVTLRELRKERGLSQIELAEALHRQQGEVSKIERRKDVLVSTLTDYVRAIQGDLQIIVRLKDGRIRRVQLNDTLEDGPSTTR